MLRINSENLNKIMDREDIPTHLFPIRSALWVVFWSPPSMNIMVDFSCSFFKLGSAPIHQSDFVISDASALVVAIKLLHQMLRRKLQTLKSGVKFHEQFHLLYFIPTFFLSRCHKLYEAHLFCAKLVEGLLSMLCIAVLMFTQLMYQVYVPLIDSCKLKTWTWRIKKNARTFLIIAPTRILKIQPL